MSGELEAAAADSLAHLARGKRKHAPKPGTPPPVITLTYLTRTSTHTHRTRPEVKGPRPHLTPSHAGVKGPSPPSDTLARWGKGALVPI